MKILMKYMFWWICLTPALPLLLIYYISLVFLGRVKALWGVTETSSCIPGVWGVFIRSVVYNVLMAQCDKNIVICFGTTFSDTNSKIGSHVYIGRRCSIGWVNIEKDVMIADHVIIPSGGKTHQVYPGHPPRSFENQFSCIKIGEGSWIGTGAIVMADIGKYCVVGAGSVVTKPVPDNTRVAGIPAKEI